MLLLEEVPANRRDLSVAGKRAGLAGERSGLFMEQMRIVKEMRNESRKRLEKSGTDFSVCDIKPRFLVWENVVGAFSSGNPAGSDFQAVLEEICKVVRHDCPIVPIPKDGWPYAGNLDGVGDDGTPFSICWRVHDAQYWGVAQRRRRVAVIADFGGITAPEILFEPYSLSGNSKQSTEKRQGTSGDSSSSLGETGQKQVEEFINAVNADAKHQQDLIQSDLGVARTLACGTHDSGPHLTKTLVTGDNVSAQTFRKTSHAKDSEDGQGWQPTDVNDTLNTFDQGEARTSTLIVDEAMANAKVYGISAYDSNAMKSDNPTSGIYEADSARTLDLNGGNPACNQGGMAVVQGADVYNGAITGEVAATVTTASGVPGGSGPSVIAFTQNEREEVRDLKDVAGAISAESGTHQQNYVMQPTGECLNSWDVQSKHIQPENGVAESLYAGETRYGGGESYVLQNQEPVLLESSQEHATVQTNGVSTTLPASMGEGGGYVPMVCIEGNGSRDSHKGDGYSETETMYTLNTVEQHAVCYGFNGQAGASVGMPIGEEVSPTMIVNQIPNVAQPVTSTDAYGVVAKGNGDAFINPNTHTSLSTGGGEPGQGYPCVLETKSQVVFSDVAATLTENDGSHGVHSQMMKHPEANFVVEMQNSKAQCMETYHCQTDEELAQTLKARDYKDPQVVAFEPGASSRLGGHIQEDMTGTLRADMGDNQIAVCHPVSDNVYTVDQGAGKSSCNVDINKSPTLTTTHGGEPVVLENHPSDSRLKISEDGMVQTLSGRMGTGGNNTPMVLENHPQDSRMKIKEDGVFQTMGARQGAEGDPNTLMVLDMLNLNPKEDNKCQTLNAYNGTGGNNMPMVYENHGQDTRYTELGETCQTVSATWGMGGNNQPLEVKPQTAVVRRLTCLECERLQGFPDFWTHIGEWTDSKGKKHKDSDAPKYKALGNSIALPFWYWMAGRMVDQLKKSGVEHPTMASLFDGIAGFPYVYIRHGCMPLWTSEIEEFPMAVCRKHFGDEDTGEVGDIEEYLKLPVNWVTNEDTVDKSAKPIIAFDRAAYNQGPNAKYDFSVEEDTAQTLVARGPGGVCQ